MSNWKDSVTDSEWKSWQKVARQAALRLGRNSSLGYEDYADQAIEKLVTQDVRPANPEAWIRVTVRNLLIDRYYKVNARGGESLRGLDTDDLDREIRNTLIGPKSAFILQESISEVLSHFSDKHQKLALMKAAGFEAEEIAEELGYASANAVLNQLARMKDKVEDLVASGVIHTR